MNSLESLFCPLFCFMCCVKRMEIDWNSVKNRKNINVITTKCFQLRRTGHLEGKKTRNSVSCVLNWILRRCGIIIYFSINDFHLL